MKSFSIGEIVESIQGRDKGQLYIVYGYQNNKALLVNGNSKLILKPKIKNLNHLTSLNFVQENIKEKILNQKTVYDAEIYSAIKKFKESIKGE